MNELLRALRPVKSRLRLRRLLHGAGNGFAFGAAAALILLTVTSFVPLTNRWIIAACGIAGCLLLGALGNFLRPVNKWEAARAADACGLQERTVTALELAGRAETDMIRVQRRDACESLRALDAGKIRPGFPRRQVVLGTGLLILCTGTLLLPGGGDRTAAAQQALKQKITVMTGTLNEAAEAEETGMTEKGKTELRKLTEELKRNLNSSRDELDALVALDKAEQQLERLFAEQREEKTAGDAMNAMEAMNALAQAMQNAGINPEASEALSGAAASGDTPAMNAALSRLDAEQLSKLAEELSGSAEMLAQQLAQAAELGEMSDAQLQAFTAGMAAGSAQKGALQQALSGMKAALGSGQQSGQPGGPGSGGQGAGNLHGQSGGGAGSGTTNEEQKGGGSSGQQSSGKGSRPPEYKEGEYETIYDPERAETVSRDVMTEQNSLEKDSVQIETGPGKGTLEGDVPFRRVLGEYAEQEAKAAESAHLTREQQEWVDEYFRKLTED